MNLEKRYGYEQTQSWARNFDFNMLDRRNRAIGYTVEVQKLDWHGRPYGYGGGESEPGQPWQAWTSVTKNGKRFGAGQTPLQADTLEELRALVFKRVLAAQKRYTAKPQDKR
jgi:hypothetical protein